MVKAPEIDDIEVDVREQPFSVFELARQYERGNLIISPDFQRNLVWKPKQMSWFIESVLLNIPLPYLYLNQRKDGKYTVVDGLRRTVTICDFLKDEFSLQELEALPWLTEIRIKNFKCFKDEIIIPAERINLVHGRRIYQELTTGRFWYADNEHTGRSAHLEVFDKRKSHIGEAGLEGTLIPGTKVRGRTIKN